MSEESNFGQTAPDEKEVAAEAKREKAKREKERRDILHNILQGALSGEKRRGVTFPDVWLC